MGAPLSTAKTCQRHCPDTASQLEPSGQVVALQRAAHRWVRTLQISGAQPSSLVHWQNEVVAPSKAAQVGSVAGQARSASQVATHSLRCGWQVCPVGQFESLAQTPTCDEMSPQPAATNATARPRARDTDQNLKGKVIGSPCCLCRGKTRPLSRPPTHSAM